MWCAVLMIMNVSRVKPIVKFFDGVLELFLDGELLTPLVRAKGANAETMFRVLSRIFTVKENGGVYEIEVPLTALPAVEVWILASFTTKPSEELLDKLLKSTPKIAIDLISELIALSAQKRKSCKDPYIVYSIAQKASKILREIIELYSTA